MSLARRASPSTFTHDTTATGAWAISAPAGVTAGDILVMKVGAIGTFTWTSGPTGWTLLADEASNSNVHVTIWGKVATGSDSYSITPSAGVKGSATVEAYTGGDVNVPFEVTAHGVATSVASVVATLTTAVANDWVSYATVSRHPTAAAKTLTTSDGSDLELLDHGTSAGPTSDVTFGSYDSNRALTAGAQSRTVTINTGTEQQFAWAMVAIRPAGAQSGALVNAEVDAPTALPPLRGALVDASVTAPAPSSGKSGGIVALSLTATLPAGSSGTSGVYSLGGGAWSAVAIHTLVNGEW